MKDTQLYEQLLGLSKPWSVSSVDIDMEKLLITVHIECAKGEVWADPKTQTRAHIHSWNTRTWRHLDTCQFETLITAQIPRLTMADGSTQEVAIPWAGPHSRITLMMEAFVLRLLQAAANISRVATLIKLDWHTVNDIVRRGVERGMARRSAEPIQHLGIDEKSFLRGQSYASVLTDIEGSRVLEVVPGRTLEDAKKLLETLTLEQRFGVEAVAVDMWRGYLSAANLLLVNAAIVHDKFHVSKYLNEAVNAIRKGEHKKLLAKGDTTLTGTKFKWLKRQPDGRTQEARRFRQIHELNLKTSRAWALKESFSELWAYRYTKPAQRYFKTWCTRAMRSQLKPIKAVTKMLRRHETGILNYIKHRITNAAAEGFNSVIQTIKANARGFRCFKNYRIRILFFCGKLDVMPDC
jgi:transposase